MPLHPQVQTLLDQLAAMDGPAVQDLSPPEARQVYKALAGLGVPEDVASVDDRAIPAAHGEIPVRVYRPEGAGPGAGVLVWFHGGGWVIGDLDTADATCRALANRAQAVVVSVDYRLAPEHPYPAAPDDARTAMRWVVGHAGELDADPARLAVGGDSAGGNLAALLCQEVRDVGGPPIRFQLLVYPVTDLTMTHPSVDENAEGYLLTKAALEWFIDHYLGDHDPKGPKVSPLHHPDLGGLPPAYVVTAEHDPLRDEGQAYAAALADAGVAVTSRNYDGQIHGFFGMASLLDDARAALDSAGGALRDALS